MGDSAITQAGRPTIPSPTTGTGSVIPVPPKADPNPARQLGSEGVSEADRERMQDAMRQMNQGRGSHGHEGLREAIQQGRGRPANGAQRLERAPRGEAAPGQREGVQPRNEQIRQPRGQHGPNVAPGTTEPSSGGSPSTSVVPPTGAVDPAVRGPR